MGNRFDIMQKGRVFLKNKMFISLSCIISFLFIFDTKASADSNQPIAPEVETTIIQEFNEPYQKNLPCKQHQNR